MERAPGYEPGDCVFDPRHGDRGLTYFDVCVIIETLCLVVHRLVGLCGGKGGPTFDHGDVAESGLRRLF